MVIFGIAFGILELIAITFALICLIPIAAFSRYRGNLSVIWPVGLLFAVVLALVNWSDWTFSSAFSTIFSMEFAKQFALYLGIGLLYSGLEFCMVARKSVKAHAYAWEQNKNQHRSWRIKKEDPVPPELVSYEVIDTNNERLFEMQGGNPDGSRVYSVPLYVLWPLLSSEKKHEIVRLFCVNHSFLVSPRIIRIHANDDGEISPKIDASELTEYVTTWTVFWPLYAVAMLFGDFITAVFEKISIIMTRIFSGAVKRMYSNVFKI